MKKILFTIDTEGPRGSNPVLTQIYGKTDDNEYYGIPKIIDIFDSYNIKGLFFVDIPEIWDYGYEKIRDVLRYIIDKGHDVGMHIHPHHIPGESRQFLFEYSKEEQRNIIKLCTDKYVEICGEMPKSFRAGKYGANYETLEIIEELGYKYDFSEFYSNKWCGLSPDLAYVLPQKYKNIVEIPVTVFESIHIPCVYKRFDKLEATNYTPEIIHVLEKYSASSNDEVLILFLHSFSFLNYLYTPDKPTLNEKNLKRFEKLMYYINNDAKYKIIREDDLDSIQIKSKDKVENIIRTKGIIRQFIYTYIRSLDMIKENKKAQLLVLLSSSFIIFLLLLFVYLVLSFL